MHGCGIDRLFAQRKDHNPVLHGKDCAGNTHYGIAEYVGETAKTAGSSEIDKNTGKRKKRLVCGKAIVDIVGKYRG